MGISGDGNTVVGAITGLNERAMKWTQSGGVQDLGTLPGFSQSEAQDASQNGSIVVGTCWTVPNGTPQAFRWTQSGGMVGLGVGTRALAVSSDGGTIVGLTGPGGNRPFTWTPAAGLQFLSTVDGSAGGSAAGINESGSIIVGVSGAALRGTMWINGAPMDLTGGSLTTNFGPIAVSDDGSVAAGLLNLGSGGSFAGVWTSSTGMMRLTDYLATNGVVIPAGVTLSACTAISADGRTFAGYISSTQSLPIQGFIATIGTPCPADLDNDGNLSNGGTRDLAVTIDDLLYFLAAFESGNPAADLDDGSSTGTHDGAVTIDDLLFFLTHFEAGC